MKTAFSLEQLKKWHANPFFYIKDKKKKKILRNEIGHKIPIIKYYKKHYRYIFTTQKKLDNSMASSISKSLKGKKRGRRWEKLVGYNLDKLIFHLEKQFNNKMNWNNYGYYWWIDHIKPKVLFKYSSAEDKEFKKCWNLKNLRPLEKMANIRKGVHYAS